MIIRFNSMDYFIEHWDSFDHKHIKTIADFVINAVSEFQDETVLYEANESWKILIYLKNYKKN